MQLRPDEQAQWEAANATLQRVRRIRVHAGARWVQFDDVDPAAEKDLKDKISAVLNEWAAASDLDIDVEEPRFDVETAEQWQR